MLAERLIHLRVARPVVLALPRGGVPVGAEVARRLDAPLDVLVSRKLGAPDQPELGVGAIAEGGARYVDETACQALGISSAALERIAVREARQVERLVWRYRRRRPLPPLAGRTAILIDDGLATGGTARAAILCARAHHPAHLVFAAPVGARESIEALRGEVDELACVLEPDELIAIGLWYRDFRQVSDDEVRAWLNPGGPGEPLADELEGQAVAIPTRSMTLGGELAIRPGARGLVLLAHGTGSSRFSTNQRFLAELLREAGFGTLLVDLISEDEVALAARSHDPRRGIELLGERLIDAIDWLVAQPTTSGLPIGCMAASTGAAAALLAAAARPSELGAVVCRGGRPDLAGDPLARVRAPTLLLVGGDDASGLAHNRAVLGRLGGETELVAIRDAGHRFEEPGALEEVGRLAAEWFARYLIAAGEPARP